MLMANLLNEDPMYGVDAVPFLATTYEESAKLWEAQKPFVEARLAKQGLRLLYIVPWPGQGFYTKKPIESLADLQGVKFRTYNAATATKIGRAHSELQSLMRTSYAVFCLK